MQMIKNKKLIIKNMIQVIAGTLILSLGTSLFLIPFELVTGGVTGLAIVLDRVISVEFLSIDVLIAIMSVTLFIMGLIFLGVDFAIKTLLHKIDAKNRLSKGEKVMVEALPTEEGGCFFIFTFTPVSKSKYRLKKKDKFLIFSTRKLDDLLDFVSIVKTERINQKCELFNMDKEFFLVIPESNEKLIATVSEYGEIYSNINYVRLKEYGKPMGNIYLQ